MAEGESVTPMHWRRIGETAMSCPPWHVARVTVRSVVSYELWHEKQPAALWRFDTFDQAKAAAERLEQEGLA